MRSLLSVPLFKVAPMVYALCILHNFCIDENLKRNELIQVISEIDAQNLTTNVRRSNARERRLGTISEHRVVQISENGTPDDLLGAGEHFDKVPRIWAQNDENTPMDGMMQLGKIRVY